MAFSGAADDNHCEKCGQIVGYYNETYVRVHVPNELNQWFCKKCADLERKGEQLLREFNNEVPWDVVADWFIDKGRQPDADWIRKYRSGK